MRRTPPLAPVAATWPAVALLLAAAAAGCAAPAGRPPVILVVIDTLRPDHLGAYGAARPTSPALDALAQESVLFSRAYAPAPWTLPSVASLFTGLYPGAHGATHIRTKLSLQAETLAERLQQRGYATAAVVSHSFLSEFLNMNQGFEIFSESEARGEEHLSTPGVTAQALQTLRLFRQQEKPFFLFLHYFDPHYRFVPHPDYGLAPARAGRLDGSESISTLRAYGTGLSGEELAFLRGLYDGEIRYTDEGLAQLLAELRRDHLLDRAVLVVTGDHGEEFLERGWLGHTRTLHEEVVRVPLMIRLPGGRGGGRTVQEPVSLVSILPTLLDLTGGGGTGFHEPSLLPLLDQEQAAAAVGVLCEVDFVAFSAEDGVKESHQKALVGQRFKLIRDDATGGVRLFDLATDPGEVQDLAPSRPQLAAQLEQALDSRLAATRQAPLPGEDRELSEEQIRLLRGLGYIGPGSEPDGP